MQSHQFNEYATAVLGALHAARRDGDQGKSDFLLAASANPMETLSAVEAVCAAASCLEHDQPAHWTPEQANALRRAAELLLIAFGRQKAAVRQHTKAMHEIGRLSALLASGVPLRCGCEQCSRHDAAAPWLR